MDQQPQPLADRIAEALRTAARDCDGTCGLTETACFEQHPIQVSVIHFDQVAGVYGYVTTLADVAAAVVEPELAALRRDLSVEQEMLAEVTAMCAATEREAAQLRAERDQLATELATRPGCPDPIECDHEVELANTREASRELAAQLRDYGNALSEARAALAVDHHIAYHQGEPSDGLLYHCGRNHCTAPLTTTDDH